MPFSLAETACESASGASVQPDVSTVVGRGGETAAIRTAAATTSSARGVPSGAASGAGARERGEAGQWEKQSANVHEGPLRSQAGVGSGFGAWAPDPPALRRRYFVMVGLESADLSAAVLRRGMVEAGFEPATPRV